MSPQLHRAGSVTFPFLGDPARPSPPLSATGTATAGTQWERGEAGGAAENLRGGREAVGTRGALAPSPRSTHPIILSDFTYKTQVQRYNYEKLQDGVSRVFHPEPGAPPSTGPSAEVAEMNGLTARSGCGDDHWLGWFQPPPPAGSKSARVEVAVSTTSENILEVLHAKISLQFARKAQTAQTCWESLRGRNAPRGQASSLLFAAELWCRSGSRGPGGVQQPCKMGRWVGGW